MTIIYYIFTLCFSISRMYVDSLNLRRTAPNCLQLTPAISLSLSLSLCFTNNVWLQFLPSAQ